MNKLRKTKLKSLPLKKMMDDVPYILLGDHRTPPPPTRFLWDLLNSILSNLVGEGDSVVTKHNTGKYQILLPLPNRTILRYSATQKDKLI